VERDTTYRATFIPLKRVTLISSDTLLGTVEIITPNRCDNDSALIGAANTDGCFVQWDDGNTDNPRWVMVERDTTYRATFIPLKRVTLISSDTLLGTVEIITPNRCDNDLATIRANPNRGCRFMGWSDGSTENPREVSVRQDITLTALFERIMHTVTFYPRNGQEPFIQVVAQNDTAREPQAPWRDDLDFDGWYTDSTSFTQEKRWVFGLSVVVTDTALYAGWIPPTVEAALLDLNIGDLLAGGDIELVPEFDPEVTVYTALLPCPPDSVTVVVQASTGRGLTAEFGGIADRNGKVTIRRESAGDHKVIVRVFAVSDQDIQKTYMVTLQQRLPTEIIRELWNDVIIVNLNPQNNGGYLFTDFLWFFDGEPFGEGEDTVKEKYLYVPQGLPDGDYHVMLRTAQGQTLAVCPYKYHRQGRLEIAAFPNPVGKGERLRIRITPQTEEKELFVIDPQGRILQTVDVTEKDTGRETEIEVKTQHWKQGVYTIKYGLEVTKVVVVR
jgi:hypothetical protein